MSARIAANLIGAKRFAPLLLAQALGAFNDNFFRYALVTLVTFSGLTVFGIERDILVPIAASMFTIAMFGFSAVAGRLADKLDRTRIMRFAKFAEIWLMLIVAAGFYFREPILLMIALFFMGVQSAFFSPAKNAALPTLLKPTELVPANALLSGTLNISILVGIGFGTWLIQRAYGPAAVGVILVVMAILGWLAIRQLPSAPASRPDMKLSFNIVGETFHVLRFAWQAPDVLRPLLGVAWFWMLAAAVVTMMSVFTASVLGADETLVLVFSALFTLGTALGAILCGTLSGDGDALPFSIAGAIGITIFTVDVALFTWSRPITPAGADLMGAAEFLSDRDNWRIVIDLCLAAVSAGLFVVPLQAMAQRRAAPELRGRLLAAGGIMNAGTATLGNFTLAFIAVLGLPMQTAFLMIGGISAFIAGVTFTRLRKRKNADNSQS